MTRRRTPKVKRVTEKRIIVGVEDMVLLQDLRDAGIVQNLKDRLHAGCIYTYIGHVLVVCNPYKWLPIYEAEVMKQYVHQSRVDVPAHIFAVAESAYRNMVTEDENQCVIISGESGSGKTEASKQIQAYIAAVSGGGEGVENIKQTFLESNPVLEAFGNAKTLRNNNSSRFGKYFELKFNRFGSPQGGVVTNYLLEKSRIVHPGTNERNFHIFYQLLAAPKWRDKLKLTAWSDYLYLSSSGCGAVDGIEDAHEFDTTLAAMQHVGIANAQSQAMLTLVGAILHLGNVRFVSQQVDGVEGSVVDPATKKSLKCFCELLKLNAKDVERGITLRELLTMSPGGQIEKYLVPQMPSQAAVRRDTVAKSLYERLFDLIVSRINVALDPRNVQSNEQDALLTVGVLDIYGFEVFQNNGFEQLCINYVNEKLQQIFIELTLRAEQEEYQAEGIKWTSIPFFNNRIVCELLDGARPAGVFRILDDTVKTMHGTKAKLDVDLKFMDTCQQIHGSHAHYSRNSSAFTIKHYAGDVTYTAGKFGESNKDALGKDLVLLLKSSSDRLVQYLYQEEVDLDDKKAPPTAGFRIRSQCQDLVKALMDCSPHYIRCIKSNESKKALSMDSTRGQHQVKYLGLAENIKVRRAGYAYRAEYHRFLERFAHLSRKTYPEWRGSDKDGCKEIIRAASSSLAALSREEVQFGATKIFIRQPETYFELEKLRENKMGDIVATIQNCWRRYVNRKAFVIMQNEIAKLFASKGKARRRDSIFRPYLGDYTSAEGPAAADELKEAMFRIIDFYDEQENIVFADASVLQLSGRGVQPSQLRRDTALQKRVLVLTNNALYLMERNPSPPDGTPTKQMPKLLLRRRIPLKLTSITGAYISFFADNLLMLSIVPQASMQSPIIDHWMPDNAVSVCPFSGKEFGLFTRRHHCRVSGQIAADECCDFRQHLPDFGYYSSTQRVADSHIGLSSCDPMEDIMLFCDKKSELLSHIMLLFKKANSNSPLLLSFTNSFSLRRSNHSDMSILPCSHVEASVSSVLGDEAFNVSYDTIGAKLLVQVPSGLSHAIVEERQKNQVARRKRAESRRRKEEEARRLRQAAKEEQREAERLAKLEQKRAAKKAQREIKRLEEEQSASLKAASTSLNRGAAAHRFKQAASQSNQIAIQSSGGAGSELAAAMAKRRQKNNA